MNVFRQKIHAIRAKLNRTKIFVHKALLWLILLNTQERDIIDVTSLNQHHDRFFH